jgi:class 3 adenylate cyclase/pimeloyl-ACP methyl ester carboxylesterase
VTVGRTRYARNGEVSLAYRATGGGPPDLLISSYGTISFESFADEPALARFDRRLALLGRLIHYDRRGIGVSDRVPPSTPGTIDELVSDALAVLDAVGSERAAIIGPWSSALTAIALAATHPDRVSHLIIIDGFARASLDGGITPLPIEWEDALPADLTGDSFDPDAVEQGMDVIALWAPSMVTDPSFRSWWDRAGNLGATPAMAEAIFRDWMTADVRHLLPEITVPTLVIDRPDSGFYISNGPYLVEQIPGARLLELPGVDVPFWLGDSGAMLAAIEEFVTGVRGDAGAERVLATVLFTDIVGSTDRAAAMGDERWRDLLDRHDKIVRTRLERFRGREVKTTGDGFVATFDSPGRAIECGLDITEVVRGIGVDIRAGVHTGEVEIRGDDIAGMAVHIGARVAALAGAGEVKVSSTVRDLLAGSRFTFTADGEHELKGVPGTWMIYGVST